MASSSNYFTCDESLFVLSKDEQENIINLINASGQRIITVENRIIQPKIVRFALNVQVKIWENYEEQDVYADAINKLLEELNDENDVHKQQLKTKYIVNKQYEELQKVKEENEQLKQVLKIYRKVAYCGNCNYHNYDWYDDGDEFEVCEKGNDMSDYICEEWREL